MPFLFPKTMAQRAFHIYENLEKQNRGSVGDYYYSRMPQHLRQRKAAVEASLEAYDFFCQKLGFAASLISGTEAFQARMILSGEVDQLSKELREELKSYTNSLAKHHDLVSLRGPIVGTILRLPLKIMRKALEPYRSGMHQVDLKLSFKRLVSYLPVLHDIYYLDPYRVAHLNNDLIANLVHTLCNPVRLLEDALSFLHKAINRFMEIGSVKGQKSRVVRKTLKGFVGVVFSAINIPVKIVSATTDLPYQVLKNAIYVPLKFLASSRDKKNNNEDQIIVKKEDVDAIEALEKNVFLKQINIKRQEMIRSAVVLLGAAAPDEATTAKIIALISEYALVNEDNVKELESSPALDGGALDDDVHQAGPSISFPEYGLPPSEQVQSIHLSNEFILFKLTPSSKRMVGQLVSLVHTELSEEDKIEAARTAIVRAAKSSR